MKKISYILLIAVALSCRTEDPVQLPEVENASGTTPGPGAPVYMLYDASRKDSIYVKPASGDPAASRLFYIDKRLRLKHIVPQLKKLRGDQEESGVKSYFSVMNAALQEPSFLDISEVTYAANDAFSKFYIKDFPEAHMQLLTLTLNFKMNNEITVDGNLVERPELISFLKEYIGFVSEGKNTLIYLNFNENLSFRDYISNYDLMMGIAGPAIKIAGMQFIYNEALLPDCNCEL